MKLSDTVKRAIFKALASKSQYAVGLEFNFDKHYKDNVAINNAVNKIYRQVRDNPEKYAVSQELIDMVEQGMESRRTLGTQARSEVTTNAESRSLENMTSKELVIGARSKIWVLLHKKIDQMGKSRRDFNKESLMSLAKVAGIVFDKAQIASGEATEHIAIRAKVDPEMPVEQMLEHMIHIKRSTGDDGDDE